MDIHNPPADSVRLIKFASHFALPFYQRDKASGMPDKSKSVPLYREPPYDFSMLKQNPKTPKNVERFGKNRQNLAGKRKGIRQIKKPGGLPGCKVGTILLLLWRKN